MKGSDASIMAKLDASANCKTRLQEEIDGFARRGLRTLAFAYKEMSSGDAINMEETFDDVTIGAIESDLKLLGATGV